MASLIISSQIKFLAPCKAIWPTTCFVSLVFLFINSWHLSSTLFFYSSYFRDIFPRLWFCCFNPVIYTSLNFTWDIASEREVVSNSVERIVDWFLNFSFFSCNSFSFAASLAFRSFSLSTRSLAYFSHYFYFSSIFNNLALQLVNSMFNAYLSFSNFVNLEVWII